MKVLPRYDFTMAQNAPKVGCADHGDPACLCDVRFDSPAPYYKGEHKFHQMALGELDDWGVSDRNVYEFFQVVMGLATLEHVLANEIQSQPSSYDQEYDDPSVSTAIRNHLKANSDWRYAYMETDMTDEASEFRARYNRRRGSYRRRLFSEERSLAVRAASKPDPALLGYGGEHGTAGALRWHYNAGVPTCDPCREYARKGAARRRAEAKPRP